MERSEPCGTHSDSTPTWLLAFLAVVLLVVNSWGYWEWRKSRALDSGMAKVAVSPGPSLPGAYNVPPLSSPYSNTVSDVAFVGDGVCARCHTDIAQAYRQHPMGRSAATPDGILADYTGLVFEGQGSGLFDRPSRWKVVPPGNPDGWIGWRTLKNRGRGAYVIGSGTRGYAFVVERAGGLFQSPISWYTQEQKWDLAPGYRGENHHFDRAIVPGCLFCHTNRFDQAEGKPQAFHGLSIGCERCHGPGELHARRPKVVDGMDLTIVNPVDLKPATLRENVCEQCHFRGSNRLEHPGRSSFDYRPGLPLQEFLIIEPSLFDPTRSNRAVGHVEQMREPLLPREQRRVGVYVLP